MDEVIKFNRSIDEALDNIKLQAKVQSDQQDGTNKVVFPTLQDKDKAEYQCDKCNLSFPDNTNYNIHMSRMHDVGINYKDVVPEVLQVDTMVIKQTQRDDPEFKFIFDYLTDNSTYNRLTTSQRTIINNYEFVLDSDGLLYCIDQPTVRSLSPHRTHLRLCLPLLYRNKFVSHMHANILSGHAGITHTYDKLRAHVWWPKMMQSIMYVLNQCPVCMRAKREQHHSPNHPVMTPTYPWQMVSIDLIGPLPVSKNGNKYILTMEDCYSRIH